MDGLTVIKQIYVSYVRNRRDDISLQQDSKEIMLLTSIGKLLLITLLLSTKEKALAKSMVTYELSGTGFVPIYHSKTTIVIDNIT